MKHRRALPGPILFLFLAGLLLPLTGGCSGSGSKSAVVSGKVTYKEQPVTGGTITLHPSDGRPDYPITIKPDGSFEVSDAPTGQMAVTVETESVKAMSGAMAVYSKDKPPAGVKVAEKPNLEVSQNMPKYVQIPAKYANVKSSGLTWDIQKGKQVKNVELTD